MLVGTLKGTKLGPSVVPFCPLLGEGTPTKIDYRKKGILVLASLLEDLAKDNTVFLGSPMLKQTYRVAALNLQDAEIELP